MSRQVWEGSERDLGADVACSPNAISEGHAAAGLDCKLDVLIDELVFVQSHEALANRAGVSVATSSPTMPRLVPAAETLLLTLTSVIWNRR